MKKLYTVLYILIVLCAAGAAVFLILSPDRVPVHYDFAGKVDRIGSKYELLLFPLFAAGMGVFFRVVARQARTRGDAANEKVLLYAGVITLVFFTALSFFFMALAVRAGGSARVSLDSINKFTAIGIGAMLVALGNFMPKARRNTAFGLRTKWSMANDAVWQKSQRFGGITLVIAGFVMIGLAILIPGIWNVLMMTVVIAVAVLVSLVASYRYYQADRDGAPPQDTANKE